MSWFKNKAKEPVGEIVDYKQIINDRLYSTKDSKLICKFNESNSLYVTDKGTYFKLTGYGLPRHIPYEIYLLSENRAKKMITSYLPIEKATEILKDVFKTVVEPG